MYLPVEKAEEFVDEVGFFTLEVNDDRGIAQQITLDLSLHKFGELQDGKVSDKLLELETAHVLVVLPAGPLVALSFGKISPRRGKKKLDFEKNRSA